MADVPYSRCQCLTVNVLLLLSTTQINPNLHWGFEHPKLTGLISMCNLQRSISQHPSEVPLNQYARLPISLSEHTLLLFFHCCVPIPDSQTLISNGGHSAPAIGFRPSCYAKRHQNWPVLMQATKKTRKRWYSKLKNSAYLLLFPRPNGKSSRHFMTNLTLPPQHPLTHEECLGNHCTLQQHLHPRHKPFLSQTLFPWSWHPASCRNLHRVLSHLLCLFSFPMDGPLPQCQAVCLRDPSQRISWAIM